MKGIMGLFLVLLVAVFVQTSYSSATAKIYNEKEIEILRQGGKILAKIMEELKKEVRPGITTEYLDGLAEKLSSSFGAKKEKGMFCFSINEEIAHVYSSKRNLKEGDVLSIDLVIRYKGYYTDSAVTVPVGKISSEADKLLKVTREALELGIRQAKLGKHMGDIGQAIQEHVEKNGFNIIQGLEGHGIGREVHEAPRVPNYGSAGRGLELKEGMVLAIEPLVAIGSGGLYTTKEGYYKTIDNSLSCHFEHTIVITKKDPKILTK